MKKADHLHLYRRVKWGEGVVFRCMKCTHYLYPEFLAGNPAECPVCHKEYLMTVEDSYKRTPHCPLCKLRKTKKDKFEKASPEMIEALRKLMNV
jgi:hypothetical protein